MASTDSNKTRNERRQLPTDKQKKIIKVAANNPLLSMAEIGAVTNSNASHVSRTLSKYGIDNEQLADYKENRSDYMAWLEHQLLSSCQPVDITKIPVDRRIFAAGLLYDKGRLETGKSTSNISVQIEDRLRSALKRSGHDKDVKKG